VWFFVRSSRGETADRLRFRDAIFAAIKAARHGGMAIVGEGVPDADDEALIAGYRRHQRKYGNEKWAPLPADDVYRLLEEIANPPELGLAPIRRGLFGRQVNADIIQLLRFSAAKGGSYGVHWGVSLSFVPHDFDRLVRRVRFHRTLTSAQFDLWESADDEFKRRGGDEGDGFIPAGYGADVFRREGTAAWELARPRVEEWFASTETVDGVLARAREQMGLPGVPAHWPEPALVAVFALTRLGRAEEAREALLDWLATRGSHIELARQAAENLQAALEKLTRSSEAGTATKRATDGH
jgi:hypothetical protein